MTEILKAIGFLTMLAFGLNGILKKIEIVLKNTNPQNIEITEFETDQEFHNYI